MVQPRPLILFFNPVRHALADYQALGKVADTQTVTSKSREEFFQDLCTKYQGAQVIYRTSASGAVCIYSRLLFALSHFALLILHDISLN
jgi:glyoxylate reductase